MREETDNADKLRRELDTMLLHSTCSKVFELLRDLESQCQTQDISYDVNAAIEYWSHLVRIGTVAIMGGSIPGTVIGTRPPEFIVTDRGKKLLERGERSPHDPEKYMLALKRSVPAPDKIALTYLDEAVGAWSAGLYRSSAVMLGCACERLVLLLAEAFSKAGGTHAAKVSKLAASVPIKISLLFDATRNSLLALDGSQKLPGNLRDALVRQLSAVFDHARGLRNQSGHPTDVEVSDQDAEAGLLLFPGFCGLIYDLIEHVDGTGAQGD